MSARNICFTINNPTEDDRRWCSDVVCDYIVYGDEVGEGGTPHIQGYIEFKCSKRFRTLKEMCPRAHYEKRAGTSQQASDYCKKDDHFVERGVLSKPGTRSDLADVVGDISSGLKMREVAETHPVQFVKYHSGLHKLQYVLSPDRTEPPRVVWLWGLAGSGKSREACVGDFYIKDNSKWWDGYEYQRRIVIDDFDAKCWEFRDFLRLLDRYPYQGQTKGGYVRINSPEMFITCEYPPERCAWNQGTLNSLQQVLRRIAEIREVIAPAAL